MSDIKVGSPIGKSDHGVVTFKILCDFNETPQTITQFLYEKANFQGMMQDLSSINWRDLFSGKPIEECCNLFKQHTDETCLKHMPRVKIKSNRKKPLWMTSRCLGKIKKNIKPR